MPSKNFWPTINLTFISVMSFRTHYASSIAPLASCADNGGLLDGRLHMGVVKELLCNYPFEVWLGSILLGIWNGTLRCSSKRTGLFFHLE